MTQCNIPDERRSQTLFPLWNVAHFNYMKKLMHMSPVLPDYTFNEFLTQNVQSLEITVLKSQKL